MIKIDKESLTRIAAASFALVAISAGVWMSHALAQTSSNPGPFTEAQAQAGQAAYVQNCAKCHDSGEATPLAGAGFLNVWGSRTTHDLFARIKDTMPVDNPGILSNETVVSIVAYLLRNNGASAGAAVFTPQTAVAINAVTTGQSSQQTTQAVTGRRARPAGSGADVASSSGDPLSADAELRRGVVPFRIGITVPGTVTKYSPITEEMMVHPPASDWLMHYWNYEG